MMSRFAFALAALTMATPLIAKDKSPTPSPAATATPTPSEAVICAMKLRKGSWCIKTNELLGNPERGTSGLHIGSPSNALVAFRGASVTSDGLIRFRRGEPITFERPDDREDGGIFLTASSVFKHSVTRGQGSMEHQSPEQISATVVFLGDPKTDELSCADLSTAWHQVFSEADGGEVAILAANPSGVLVDEIKAGMSTTDVEGVLGPPDRKADLGTKLVYFYPKMKITFVAGKVSDVD